MKKHNLMLLQQSFKQVMERYMYCIQQKTKRRMKKERKKNANILFQTLSKRRIRAVCGVRSVYTCIHVYVCMYIYIYIYIYYVLPHIYVYEWYVHTGVHGTYIEITR